MSNLRHRALQHLYGDLRQAKQSLGRAERRPGVKEKELDNLRNRIEVLDWVIALVIATEEDTDD